MHFLGELMSWVPGWESIQATGWWSGFFFWASIVSLIGLGISEVASHRFSERKDELVERQQIAEKERHDTDIARVQHDAALAIERAASLEKEAETARASIADANARAAEATRQAAQAQLALEKFKQPRAIPDLRVFGGKLKQFAKTRFDMSVLPGDPEAAVLMSQIAASLEEAGWIWVEYNPPNGTLMMVFNMPGKPNIGQEGWRGVSVQVFDEYSAELSPAANAVAGELMVVGIEVTRDKAAAVIPNKDTIHILVGKKPT